MPNTQQTTKRVSYVFVCATAWQRQLELGPVGALVLVEDGLPTQAVTLTL